jgi:Protein of unknown function (DUF1549)/Protein of unknown function (DUF1553)
MRLLIEAAVFRVEFMVASTFGHRHSSRLGAGLALLFLAAAAGFAQRAIFPVATESALTVLPASVELDGRRACVQLIVVGKAPDSSSRDVTAQAVYRPDDDLIAIEPNGFVRARRDGTTTLTVEANGKSLRVPVTVRRTAEAMPVSFRRDVIAALSVGGCNQGSCHGTPAGKNGFALSLRGGDPAADFRALTRDQFGRRTSSADPDASLMLQKGLGTMPHEGGVRWRAESVPAQLVRDWIAAGCPNDSPALPSIARLEILPGPRTVHVPDMDQQLAVRAHFADGGSRDVTRLCVFTSSDPAIADVGETGRVVFARTGEAAILVRYLDVMQVIQLTCVDARPEFQWPSPPEVNDVDRLLFAKLKQMRIAPADMCSDAQFLRRVSLDLTGAVPTPAEARAFLNDPTPNKRERAIDRLLESPGFADFWALKWADVLRTSRKTMQVKGAQGLHGWLRAHLAANTPFDRIVRELLTATGSSAVSPAGNFYRVARDPSGQAEAVAQLFCGVRLQCAKCHNHPFERWTQDDYVGMASFFARVRARPDPTFAPPAKNAAPEAEIVYVERTGELTNPRTGQPVPPRPLGGTPLLADGDRRVALADWLTAPANPFFARSVANRVWFHLFGRGIVDPVDDLRDSNPPAHPALLDFLARDFATHQYDLRRLLRLVLLSRTYQLGESGGTAGNNDDKYFARSRPRLLSAEQLLDAVCDVTGVPERFAGLPLGTRAVQLPDGDGQHPFLKAFGQPARELPCECERDGESNLAQALQLVSGPTLHDKLREPKNRIGGLLAKAGAENELFEELFLAAYGRLPQPRELETAHEHMAKAGDPRRGLEDLLWALLNSPEFLFRR